MLVRLGVALIGGTLKGAFFLFFLLFFAGCSRGSFSEDNFPSVTGATAAEPVTIAAAIFVGAEEAEKNEDNCQAGQNEENGTGCLNVFVSYKYRQI